MLFLNVGAKHIKISEVVNFLIHNKTIENIRDLSFVTKDFFKHGLNRLLENELNYKIHRETSLTSENYYRNGYTFKKISSLFGTITLDVPRVRKKIMTFENIFSEIENAFSYYLLLLFSLGIKEKTIQFLFNTIFEEKISANKLTLHASSYLKDHKTISQNKILFDCKCILVTTYKHTDKSFVFVLSKSSTLCKMIGVYELENSYVESYIMIFKDLTKRGLKNIDYSIVDFDENLIAGIISIYKNIKIQISLPEFIKEQTKFISDINSKKLYRDKMRLIKESDSSNDAIKKYNRLLDGKSFLPYKKLFYTKVDHIFNFLDFPSSIRKKSYSLHSFNKYKRFIKTSLSNRNKFILNNLLSYIDFSIQVAEKTSQ